MSILNCWFRKKKKKHCNKDDVFFYKEEPKLIYAVPNVASIHNFNKLSQQARRRNSDAGNVYLVADNYQGRKTKSYPPSPSKATEENRPNIPYKRNVPVVYVANTPGVASIRHSISQPPPEHFPFEIPKPEETVPRRSSLFYGIRNDVEHNMSENLKRTAEKPMEDAQKHVTIKLPTNNTTVEDYDVNEPVKRTTIVRLRPSSFSQPPGEYVKQMAVRASITNPQPSTTGNRVVNMPMKPVKDPAVLITSGGKMLKPIGTDKIRTSISKDPQRESVLRTDNELRKSHMMTEGSEQIVHPVPLIQAKRTSFVTEQRKSITRDEPNAVERRESVRARQDSTFPLNRDNHTPMVYAVPTIPSRGRSKSLLHQSVKSFTSRESADLSSINKKNIRRSMDTDVFSSQTRRRSEQKNQPGYVNMERGQTVLVSELLNPISSIFVSDLKDQVPKDPQKKPKEYNSFPKSKRQSIQSPSKQTRPVSQQPRKSISKAPVITYQESRTKQTRKSRYMEDSSSSEESVDDYPKKSKRGQKGSSQSRYAVYAAQVGPTILPQEPLETGKNPPFKKKGKPEDISTNKDFCGLGVEPIESFHLKNSNNISRPNMVSYAQQTDFEDDEMDLLCYPVDKLPRDFPLTTESGSKLRWRIIIKR